MKYDVSLMHHIFKWNLKAHNISWYTKHTICALFIPSVEIRTTPVYCVFAFSIEALGKESTRFISFSEQKALKRTRITYG